MYHVKIHLTWYKVHILISYDSTYHLFCIITYYLLPNTLSDVSGMSRTANLRNQGEKTVLVKAADDDISSEVEQDYIEVIYMDSVI